MPRKHHVHVAIKETPRSCGEHRPTRSQSRLVQETPHSCGEHQHFPGVDIAQLETPPLMRGTQRQRTSDLKGDRNTPAHAGNISLRSLDQSWSWKHPRSCGEHGTGAGCQGIGSETPPLMRGTPRPLRPRHPIRGNTPAHAGNTPRGNLRKLWRRKHPRSCGEHYVQPRSSVTPLETPPLMRGTHDGQDRISSVVGNTPAHAGNTSPGARRLALVRKHPRSCGEHGGYLGACDPMPETPPLMRGTRHRLAGHPPGRGNTPAHAGNTW